MAKRLRKNREPGKIFIPDPAELNRWCIEMAMRWPTHDVGGYGGMNAAQAGMYGQLNNAGRTRVDDDVLGRANKIRAWVVSTL